MTRTLRFDEAHSAYVLTTADVKLVEQTMKDGWARDTAYQGKGYALFTREPYAAVHHISASVNDETRNRLITLAENYASSLAESADNKFPVPAGMELMPFQKAGVRYALSRAHPLIGDEMGLGKTAQAVVTANEMQAERMLVVCPANARLQWQGQVRQWSTLKKLWTYPILKSADGVSPYANWIFVSYDLIRNENIRAALDKLKFDMLILDEEHYLKTSDSGRTRTAFGDLAGKNPGIAVRAEKTMGLTGTPLPNRPRECLDGSVQVLTNRGWVPIVEVKTTDLLWDGVEWVKHGGLLYQGCAKTVSVAGILATASHRFLAKSSWVSAAEACQNMGIVRQLLARGSDNLPLWAWNSRRRRLYTGPKCNATVDQRSSKQQSSACVPAAHHGADLAERWAGATRHWLRMYKSVQTTSRGAGSWPCSATLFSGATTQKTSTINRMVAGVFRFFRSGLSIVRTFWPTWYPYPDGMPLASSLTGLKTKEDTSQGTFDGQPAGRICKIGVKSTKCNNGSTALRPVYDIANAGPRRRFTVLSNQGPIISHNCYTIARHHDWSSIDWLSEQAFEHRFNPSAKLWTGKVLEEVGRLPELRARLRCNFMVRRVVNKVLPQLPKQHYELTYVEPNGAIRRVLKAESLINIDIDHMDDMDMATRGHIATVRREMGVAKIPRIIEHVSMLMEGGLNKLVVAAFHKEVMATLADKFSRYGCAVVTGGQTPMRREREKMQFIKGPNCRIFLGQLFAAGEALDGLQDVCNRGVFAEADWTPKTNDQFAARLRRMGQTRGVFWQFLVAPGSLDERVLGRAIEKAHNIHKALDAE